MPVKFSDKPDTIAGFDIVVSISEEAVNAQLLKLYNKPLSAGRLIPASKLKDFKPIPPSQHLINHRLSLHLINKKLSTAEKIEYRETGIDGYIECPKVRFRPEDYCPDSGNAVDKYKKAYLEIKFKKSEIDGSDSKMLYYDEDEGGIRPLILNGCTMVWGVKIGRRDVQDVMEEIIKPSKDSDNPAATDTNVTEKLKKYVDSSVFSVATIFCLFEEKSMTDSFILIDEKCKPIQGSALQDARRHVTLFFSSMTDQWKENNGTPFATTENPYILGYGISQKKVSIKDIDSSASEDKTPEYFKPKQLAMSVTPGESKQEWTTTSGSLNYCLLTHRSTPDGHEPVDIDEADLNAGVITKNFFEITKTMGRTSDLEGNTQGHDGIMAFSKGIFSGLWLQSIAEPLLLDPSSGDFKIMIAKGLQKDVNSFTVTLGTTTKSASAENGWELCRSWRTDIMDPPEGQAKTGPGSLRQFILGDCRVRISYKSDTSSITSVQDGITHARRIFFDIEFENKWDYILQKKNWFEHLFDDYDETNKWLKPRLRGFPESDFCPSGKSDFLNATSLSMRMKSLVRVVMNPGAVGKWNIDIDESASHNLFKKGSALTWTSGSVDSNDYGNFSQHKNFYGYTFNLKSELIQGALTGWGVSTKDVVADQVKNAFADLTTTVIMPAGDVFTFAGLDTDDAGNLYTQVNFANDGGYEVNKGTQKA